MLWNCYYADARTAINDNSFQEVIFADDLNGFKEYSSDVPNDEVLN